MKILIAANAFKNSLSAVAACEAIKKGLEKRYPNHQYDLCPVCDGGDGTCEVISLSIGAETRKVNTTGPFNEPIVSEYGYQKDNNIAVIEIAKVAGLSLIDNDKRNPEYTTTYGAGALIKDALDNGCKTIIFCVGGTGTNDAGMGMLSALGVKFYDRNHNVLPGIGKSLIEVDSIDLTELDCRLKETKIIVANDVTNCLYGENGAAYVYAKQKGADKEMIKRLDEGLKNFASVLDKTFNVDSQSILGGGSGGGIGVALNLFLNASLESGFDIVKQFVNLEDKIKNADIVITGEGKLDSQTKNGKAPIGVARLAKKYDKKVVAICGKAEKDISFKEVDEIFILCEFAKEISLKELINEGYTHLARMAETISL